MRGEHIYAVPRLPEGLGSSPHARGTLSLSRVIWIGRRDHPRMRGEHTPFCGLPDCVRGSSPHARGTPPRHPFRRRTHVDHPRMRGEHVVVGGVQNVGQGSSPHARGTLEKRPDRRPATGIIPACAGNTSIPAPSMPTRRDHPRMRGEHITYHIEGETSPGSSPHARGTHFLSAKACAGIGIIPACAGNTAHQILDSFNARDHPRMRGEHHAAFFHPVSSLGSSPHARGTPRVGAVMRSRLGIIPACAGNTAAGSLPAAGIRDHPRMRGEHSGQGRRRTFAAGSSPHARGTRGSRSFCVLALGIIPACAGNTVSETCRSVSREDHPRMRGEHIGPTPHRLRGLGSSPHARGTLDEVRGDRYELGIIPACAGNTRHT